MTTRCWLAGISHHVVFEILERSVELSAAKIVTLVAICQIKSPLEAFFNVGIKLGLVDGAFITHIT